MDSFQTLAILGDEGNLKILAATFNEPKSVQELVEDLEMPIATVYRKINELEQSGLLRAVENVLTNEGKRVKIYWCQVNAIHIKLHGDKLGVTLDLASTSTERIIEMWIKERKERARRKREEEERKKRKT